MSVASFTDAGLPVPDRPVANIFAFLVFMAATVAHYRGGKPHQYIAECADFMELALGRRLSVSDPLPDEYDWRPSVAAECAIEMMETI